MFDKKEYNVEFDCICTFRVNFRELCGLNEEEVIREALKVVNNTFKDGGYFSLERFHKKGYYFFTILGIDRLSGRVLFEENLIENLLNK